MKTITESCHHEVQKRYCRFESILLRQGVASVGAFTSETLRVALTPGLHFGWNFTQGAVFGAAVSGYQLHGVYRFTFSGPTLVTGGAFGPEASIYAVVFRFIFA